MHDGADTIMVMDTSGTTMAVVLGMTDGTVIGEWVRSDCRAQALTDGIHTVLDDSATDLSDITRFAICLGPGSFTGTRVGVATFNGLYAGLADRGSAPAVVTFTRLAVAAHEVVLNQQFAEGDQFTCLVDAQRGEYFMQVFTVAATGNPTVTSKITTTRHDDTAIDDVSVFCPVLSAQALLAAAIHSAEPAQPPLIPLYGRAPDAQPSTAGVV